MASQLDKILDIASGRQKVKAEVFLNRESVMEAGFVVGAILLVAVLLILASKKALNL